MKFMGREGYAKAVEQQIELTKYLAEKIDALENFTRVGEVETAVCCFRLNGPDVDRLQQRLQQTIERSGEAWLTTTVLHGHRAMRVNVNSFLTEKHHIDGLVELLKISAAKI